MRPQYKKQERKTPVTVDEKMRARDIYIFSRSHGTLKCKGKKHEIESAHFGGTKPGDKVRHYQVPFSEAQAREICFAFNHELLLR